MSIGRKTVAVLMAVAATAVVVVASPTPASALPSNCGVYAHPTGQADGRMARCTRGTGEYRLRLRCNEGAIYDLPDYWVYGPWKSPSATSFSAASCFTGRTSGFYRGASVGLR
ncbi:hypothetical protein [Plantactinospora sp. CA-290183]|uniref:hypothetical protein n=1 Tax=Plantactinospora sp. CA-290183 TaxID=3240006 RepID=UPI003D937491